MIDGVVAKRYAEALFEVAKEKNLLDKVEEDLLTIVQIMNQTDNLLPFFRHPQIDTNAKKELVEASFKDNISEVSKNFIFQLIDNRRIEFIDEVLKLYVRLANQVRGVVDVEAITANVLDEASQAKVVHSLNEKLGKKVRLKNVTDPSIIGGMIIKIGDRVFDGSIDKQLKVLKRSLTASRV